MLADVASARGSGSTSSVSSVHVVSFDEESRALNQTLSLNPSGVRPPNRYRPLAVDVPTASLNATGKARTVDSVQPVS